MTWRGAAGGGCRGPSSAAGRASSWHETERGGGEEEGINMDLAAGRERLLIRGDTGNRK